MASNKEVDALLNSGEHIGVVRTGTFVIHGARGKPMGEKIEYERITYNVPKEYQGPEFIGKMLVFEQSTGFEIDRDGNVTGKVVKVMDIPLSGPWQLVDTETGIPKKESSNPDNPDARRWCGSTDAGIFAIVRCETMGKYVLAYNTPSDSFEVIWKSEHEGELLKDVANLLRQFGGTQESKGQKG
jgi:hypothetical protein